MAPAFNHGSNSTSAVVLLGTAASGMESESPFLFQHLNACHRAAQHLYASFVDGVVDGVVHAQVKKRDHLGILSFVSAFSRFVKDTEAIGARSASRPLFDAAYARVLDAVFARVQEVAADAKEPDVVLFENFHNLHDQLSRLKVESLKVHRSNAQEQYRTHLDRFVKGVLGRPMEKLSHFFEGVEQLIRQGTSPEDVGYYSEFSKQQLRATIKLYPGKEVKKGLEATYSAFRKKEEKKKGRKGRQRKRKGHCVVYGLCCIWFPSPLLLLLLLLLLSLSFFKVHVV